MLTKDEIKKNTFSITLGTRLYSTPFRTGSGALTLQDANARINGDGVNNADGGDYGVLFSNSAGTGDGLGVVFIKLASQLLPLLRLVLADFAKHPTHGNQTPQQASHRLIYHWLYRSF